MAKPIRQGDGRTYQLQILDEDGDPPAGGTLGWRIFHGLKDNEDDTTELLTKDSANASEIAPSSPNPNSNLWDIFYTGADTAALPTDTYARYTKIVIPGGEPQTIQEDTLLVKPQGVSDPP